MLLDVIIPVYNSEQYLPTLFQNLKLQTMQDFNIYLVDDCSSDKSLEIILENQLHFKGRFYLIRNKRNMGPAMARNVALDSRKECSEFTMFIDADDVFEADYFERMVNVAQKYNVDMVICGIDRRDEEGRVLCREMVNNTENVITEIAHCSTLGYMVPVLWNKLFRNSCIQGYRFPDAARSEDTIFIYEILPDIKSIKFINCVLYHYIVRENSMTGTYTEEMHNTMLSAFADLKQIFCMNQRYNQYEELLEVQMFIRCAIGGTYRLAFKNIKNIFRYEKNTMEYLNAVFPQWYKNKYLCLKGIGKRSLKENAVCVCALLYRIHLFSIFIIIYWIISKVIKKDIRF